MKYLSKQFTVSTASAVLTFVVGLTCSFTANASNPSASAAINMLPAFEAQPSAQSSGLELDILGIPTGNGSVESPSPDIDFNRCGPRMAISFGQVVYSQTDTMIKGRDNVTNLSIERRHFSRRNQTKALMNEELTTGSLTSGVVYQWVDIGSGANFSNVGAGNAGTYVVGDTFTASTSAAPTSWGGATLQLAEQVVAKHSIFGPSWAFNYSHTITRYGDDVLMDSYGRRDVFTNVAANVWEGTEGRFDRLTYDSSSTPAKYVLRMPHGTLLEFEADDSAVGKPAHLTKIISPNTSNTLQFTYETTASTSLLERKLLSITDTFGRTLTLAYNDTDYPEGASSITDFNGRTIQYDYDSTGRLLSKRSPTVTSPDNSNDFPNGKVYNYQYLDSTVEALSLALTAVIAPNQVADGTNTPYCQWTYDENVGSANTGSSQSPYLGYVQTYTLGSGSFSYVYSALRSFSGAGINDAVREIKVTDRMGTTTVYKTNRLGQILSEEITTPDRSYTQSFEYNNDGQLTKAYDAMGSKTEYWYTRRRDLKASDDTFPNSSNPRNVEFPLTDVFLFPDSRSSDQDFIRTRIVPEPIYNMPFQSIDPRAYEAVENVDKQARIAQFTTTHSYDYMEDLDDNLDALAALFGITTIALNGLLPSDLVQLGNRDINEDGIDVDSINGSETAGNVIHIKYPDVSVNDIPGVDEAALGAVSTAAETYVYNTFGQVTRHEDPNGNVTTYSYFDLSDNDPSSGNSGDGGYLRQIIADAESGGDSAVPISQSTTYEYTAQTVDLEPGDQSDTAATFPANPRGIPTAVIDARGVKTAYYVNELDQVMKTVLAAEIVPGAEPNLDEFGYEMQISLDANDNVVEGLVENEGGLDTNVDDMIVSRASYDILDQVDGFVVDDDEDGDPATDIGEVEIRAQYAYDANQNPIDLRSGDPSNNAYDEYTDEGFVYDERDLLVQTIRGEGEDEEASFEQMFDANGQMVVAIDGEDADVDGIDIEDGFEGGDPARIVYDGFDRKREVIDRSGNRTVYTYDSASNVTKIEVYGPVDDAGSEVLLSQTDMIYDERNRLIRFDEHLFHYNGKAVGEINDIDSNEGDGVVSEYRLHDRGNRVVGVLDGENDFSSVRYDGLSRVIERVDAEGNRTEFVYDPVGNLLEEDEFEVRSDDPSGVTESFSTAYIYDSLNRLIRSVEPNGQETTYAYDSRSNLVRVTDPLGNVEEMTYDRVNRLIQKDTFLSSDGTGADSSNFELNQSGDGKISIKTEWDDLGRMIAQIDDNGARVEYAYDDLGRIVSTTYEDNTTEEWTYNDDGDVLTYKNRNGTVITRTYDAESRMLSETSFTDASLGIEIEGTGERRWTYDGLDRVVSAFNDNDALDSSDDVTCFYTYDSLSRVIRETQRIGSSDLSVIFEWEGNTNHKIETTYPNGRTIQRTYDDLSRLETIREQGAVQSQIASYTYIGQVRPPINVTYGNGVVQTRTFDTNRRTTSNQWQKNNSVITNYAYTYNNANRIKSENRLHLTGNNFDTYTFDSAYRMTGFREDGSGINAGGQINNRQLNGADMMIEFRDNNVLQSLEVDGSSAPKLNRYTQFNGKSREFDNNGSLDDANSNDSNDSGDLEFVQDYLKRIVEVRRGDGTDVAYYAYDADGRRVLKTTGGKTTRYIYDGWKVIEERDFDENTVLRQYVDGAGIDEHVQMRVFAANNSSSDYYYHLNEPGFVGALTDSSGAVVEYYEYEWLGEVKVMLPGALSTILSESTVGNPYAFQGRRLDSETGLYYYRHRYYDSDSGQFVTVDPLGMWNHGQGNGRSAFDEDPVNMSDPFGLQPNTNTNSTIVNNNVSITKREANVVMEFARANNKFSHKFINFKHKIKPKWLFGVSKAQRKAAKKTAVDVKAFMDSVKDESKEFKNAINASAALNSVNIGSQVATLGAGVATVVTAGAAAPAMIAASATSKVAKGASGAADIRASRAIRKLNRQKSTYDRHGALADLLSSRGKAKLAGAAIGTVLLGANAGLDVIPVEDAIVSVVVDQGGSAALVAGAYGANFATGVALSKSDKNVELIKSVIRHNRDAANAAQNAVNATNGYGAVQQNPVQQVNQTGVGLGHRRHSSSNSFDGLNVLNIAPTSN